MGIKEELSTVSVNEGGTAEIATRQYSFLLQKHFPYVPSTTKNKWVNSNFTFSPKL
jgi:hypothetical protein